MTENLLISKDSIDVNVGKRVRMDCQLNNTLINENRKGLWLRLEDTEIFYYSTSRITSDKRFQIDYRRNIYLFNKTYSYEIITYSLIINDVNLFDNGTYSCQSDNQILKLYLLNIFERPYFLRNEYSTLIRIEIGKNLSINCHALGKPQPSISWIKKLHQNNKKLIIDCLNISSICQLNISNISINDNGIYECIAMNFIGTITLSYQLDILFPPSINCKMNEYIHRIGDTVILECIIHTNPSSDIKWFHRFSNDNNQEINLSKEYLKENQGNIWYIENKQLNKTIWKTILFIKQIPKRLFNSYFICRALNSYGSNEQIIIIIQKLNSFKESPYTTPFNLISTLSFNQYNKQLSNTTHLLVEKTNEIFNQSNRIDLNLFILIFYLSIE